MRKIIGLLLVLLLTFTLAACGGSDVDDILDCINDPDHEDCNIDDIIDDPVDDRTAEEILADAIIENWDGDVTHLNVLLDAMDFTDSMELEAEFNFEATDSDGVSHIINVVMIDSYVFLPTGDVLHRYVDMNIDDELLEFTIIYEEVDTGVVIYLEISDIRSRLAIEEPEANSILDVLGVDQDWLKFRFDDSLTNMIEIEVLREMFATIFFNEMGEDFFYLVEDDIEDDTGLLLSDYNLDIGLLMDTLADGDYAAFETMLNNVDFDNLIFDLDEVIVVPELVAFLTANQTEFEAESFDVVNGIIYLEANGTEAFLGNLSGDDLTTFITILTAPRKIDLAVEKLEQQMPWQVISVINLPTEDLENGATISWTSNDPALITAEGVVTPPGAGEWNIWVTLTAIVTVGEDSRELFFDVTVPPVDAEGFGDEYHDNYYDEDRDDPVGDYLKETVDLYEVILLIKDLKDTLLAVDYSALVLETVDHEALIDAVYLSQAGFDAYIVTLATTSPESALILGTFSPVVGYLEEFVFVTDVRYALDNLTMFEQYLTIDYYLDNDYLDVEIGKTDTFAIETTISVAPMAFGALFVDVVGDVSVYLSGFSEIEIPYIEHINCPTVLPEGEECEPIEDYNRIIERLNNFSQLEMIATYDPGISGEINVQLNFTDLLDAVINMELYDDELLNRAIKKLEKQMPWQVIAVIDLPTEDLENEATIVWESNRPELITAAGVVTAPIADDWNQWVTLTATITVGEEEEILYFDVTVPPVNAMDYGDEYYDHYDENDGLDIESVENLSFTVTVREDATVTLPTVTNDVNAIAEDFARFSLSIMAYDYLENIALYYVDNPSEFLLDLTTTKSLVYYVDEFYVTLAFDDVLSEVVIGGTVLNPTFSIELYWIDGTTVFDAPLTLAELVIVVGPNTGGPATNVVFQYYVDSVNEANFNMTKLIFVYIFNDTYEEDNN